MHPVQRTCHLVISAHPRSWRQQHGAEAHSIVGDLVEEGWSPWRILDSFAASLVLQRCRQLWRSVRERPFTFVSGGVVGALIAVAGMLAFSHASSSVRGYSIVVSGPGALSALPTPPQVPVTSCVSRDVVVYASGLGIKERSVTFLRIDPVTRQCLVARARPAAERAALENQAAALKNEAASLRQQALSQLAQSSS